MPRIEIVADGESTMVPFRGGAVTIGRQDDNDIVLADTKASRRHCRIEYVGGRYRVRDLASHNGTWIGHDKVQERNLQFGQAIRIGSTYIRLVQDPNDLNANAPLPNLEELADGYSDAKALDALAGGVPVERAPETGDQPSSEHRHRSPFLISLGKRTIARALPAKAGDLGIHNSRREPIVSELEEAPQIRQAMHWLRELLYSAIAADAASIHIEPQSRAYLLRFRIDGFMHTVGEVPIREARCVVEVIRRLCELEVRPELLTETGRFGVESTPNEFLDYRAHFASTAFGQRVVLKRIDATLIACQLESLGLDLDSVAALSRVLERQQGLLLFCGPSGSGTTTTAYCAAGTIDPEGHGIAIIEEAPEYPLAAAVRLSSDMYEKMRFAEWLREAISQDPDVILVSRLGDRDTASLALDAAINGRLVLTTMEAPSVETAIQRLLGWGVEPYLIANGLSIVTSQRLIRTLCPACRRQYEPDAAVLEKRGLAGHPHGAFYDAVGCAKCLRTGFRGQTGVFEVVQFNQALRDVIIGRPGPVELRRAVSAQTNQTLQESAYKQVIDGTTTLPEADRVLPSD